MNNIGFNIRQIRQQRGYTQDYMAGKLDITQASYARMENAEIKISVDKLEKIAEILGTDVSAFFDSKITIQNQTNSEGAYGNGYVENLYIENKETLKKLVQTLENENEHLKKEVEFLRELVRK